MRKVTTEYTCDGCGAEVETVKELQKFRVELMTRGSRNNEAADTELCDTCESIFLSTVEPYFPSDEIAELQAMRRED